jgi:hypothetical protein
MKFFAVAIVLAISFMFVVLSMFWTRDSVVVEEKVPVVSAPRDSIESSEVADSAYSYGFDRGRACFLVQMGEDVKIPSSSRYMVEGHWSEDEVGRGYVDGYHRAASMFSCPGK